MINVGLVLTSLLLSASAFMKLAFSGYQQETDMVGVSHLVVACVAIAILIFRIFRK